AQQPQPDRDGVVRAPGIPAPRRRESTRPAGINSNQRSEEPMTRDQYLFAVMPYLAAASCVALGFVRVIHGRTVASERSTGASVIWRWAIAVVLAGHVLAFAFPAHTLAWNRAAWRMYALEASGSMAALLALAAFAATIMQRRRSARVADSGVLHT